jgi:2-methylcitrate dehydratase PrpD
VLRHGLIDHHAFANDVYRDPAIRPLMNRVTVRVIDEFEKDFPRRVGMRMVAKDKAGKSYEVTVINPLGHEDNPVSAKDLAEKFTRLCEPGLGAEKTASALKHWQNIETASSVTPAFDALVVG